MHPELLKAIETGDIKTLESLIASGVDIKQKADKHGTTALLLAAGNSQIPMLEHLLRKKYSTVIEKTKSGTTALLMAASKGHISMLEHLLAKKYATITEKTNGGNTALLVAARGGHIPLLEHLLDMKEVSIQERNTSEGDNVLTLSAWNDHSTAVAYLLRRGAYIDLLVNDGRSPVQVIQGHYNKNALPLLQAAENLIQVATGKQAGETAEALVKTLGENLNARRVLDGNTALHLAIINKNVPLIKLLLANGADVTMPNKDQEIPLQLLLGAHFNDPYILAVTHAENISQIAKTLDQQQKSSTKPGPAEDLKQRFEFVIRSARDAGDEKGSSEGLTIAGLDNAVLQNKNAPLLAQCAASIEELESQLEKLPIATENQRKEKQDFCYKVGALLANPLSSVYNPVAAYGFLSQITKESNKFAEAQGLMADLLISGNIIFQNSGLETEPISTAVSAAMGLEASTEDATCRALRQKAIIRHLLQGTSKHEEVIGKFIAEYTLGAEKSVMGLANVKGKDVDSQMALIEAFREKELENKLLQEKLQESQTKEAQTARQFALMQEKLKQFEAMEAENRRLAQENAALKNQNLGKDNIAGAAPKPPKGLR